MNILSQCVIIVFLLVFGTARAGNEKLGQIPVADQEITAISSQVFLSSLGVNTHVDQGYNPESYIQPLQYLGVRNIRDSQRNLSGLIMLHAQTGVLVDLLGADVAGLTVAANTLAQSGALLSIEGP